MDYTRDAEQIKRVPACTFAQWLELVLDGNLEPYLTYCLMGDGGRTGRFCRFSDNRFVHQGLSDHWAGYL